ncbi:hypothetical protein EAH89_22685 [Roseomonas nepalensis]|uniref:Uncharacterized protein n=1 Tax=Muricoccus nepalensis TaxID=1854500 RepID=A0A502FG29_9PROT|nr:DUF6544 family protein [Roseomonas nepalensis]TPG48395.1 hypothetical protein EAH89_22685 [Roseomonas nepalensis]
MVNSGLPPVLPPEVRALAQRLGAAGRPSPARVTLTQAGTMRDGPTDRFAPFSARQGIDLQRPAFTWRARTGPLGCVAVTDALQDGEAWLEVRFLGLLRIAGLRGGEEAARGEMMRYLAELAWAPDAILSNPFLSWRVLDERTLRVAAGQGAARAEVELGLDEEGRIASARADDRPRHEGGRFVPRPWRGRFHDHRRHEGRWLPFAGEVGWQVEGRWFTVWQGRIERWAIA